MHQCGQSTTLADTKGNCYAEPTNYIDEIRETNKSNREAPRCEPISPSTMHMIRISPSD